MNTNEHGCNLPFAGFENYVWSADLMGEDCTNHGISGKAKYATLCLTGCDNKNLPTNGVVLQLFVEIDANPEAAQPGRCMLAKPSFVAMFTGEERFAIVRVYAHPVGKPNGMFGGRWAESSDSRFPTTTPIPVFDRFER